MLLFLFSIAAYADCPLQQAYSGPERHDIQVADLTKIFEQSKGCLTVIEIWASWCGPCVQIAPEVKALHESYPSLTIMSISADATGAAAEQYWRKHTPIGPKLRFSQWTLGDLSNSFATVGATFPEAIPYFVVLGPNGSLLYETHEPKSLVELTNVVELAIKSEKLK